MITVGTMQLHQVEASDPMEPYFVGGEHSQDVARLSSHDHSGGLLGAPVAVTIPDGSITTADLDPSVLAPYALTDGSKPFTGEVTMQADAIIRDALRFGQQGSALAPDATLSRTGPGALRLTGTAQALHAAQAGAGTVARFGQFAAVPVAQVTSNLDYAGGGWQRDNTTLASGLLELAQDPVFSVSTAAAGANPATPTRRLALSPGGSLTLSPDAPQPALVLASGAGTSALRHDTTLAGGGGLVLRNGATDVLGLNPNNLFPLADNLVQLGHAGGRYTTVYAVAGAINTSSRTVKEGITPLDPALAMAAVRNTPAVTFDYLAPARTAEWYDLPDDPEQAQAVLQQRLTAAPLEAAARHQHGFIAETCDELFLVGEGQTSPGSSIGVLLAALQNIDSRLRDIEGA